MDFLKKLKRLKAMEPLGIFGFFSFTAFCLLCCFLYLDYRVVTKGSGFQTKSLRLLSFGFEGFSSNKKVEFLSSEGDDCNLFEGDWVWDESYPLYESRNCKFLDDGFRCLENGRPDDFYTKWRWQPKYCNLPRFDGKTMLEKLRNRRLVFVGDSIGRNQWESLLCMLSSAVADQNSIYEVNGNPITKHKGSLVFRFKDFNCTVEYYRAPFLVVQSRPLKGAPAKVKLTLRLDIMDWSSRQWSDADVLVFNTGHWWNYEKTIRGGCYFQVGDKVKMEMSAESAYRRSIETLLNWIDKEVKTKKTQVVFRTYAPAHFRGGDWRHGGNCHLETLPELSSTKLFSHSGSSMLTVIGDVISNRTSPPQMKILNITTLTALRKDGHSSLYYLGPNAGRAPLHRQDCSHWCLPGVPDVWNELLYAVFLKGELIRHRN